VTSPGVGTYGDIETKYTGEGPRVVVLGDSIMVATRSKLRAQLYDHSLKVAALAGEGLSGGALSAVLDDGVMLDVAEEYGRDAPAVVVIELGTNDAWFDELSVSEAEAGLQAIWSRFSEVCRVVVTVAESASAPDYDGAEGARINVALTATADHVVDWRSLSADQPGLLNADGIHPTADGAAVLARAISDAVRSCSA
jgi:lysophospholipase L1-like esterase